MASAQENQMTRVRLSPGPRGQGLAEYVLILALITIVAISALLFLGGGLGSILSVVGQSI
jgi:Flp pilus assembly pilin Flp